MAGEPAHRAPGAPGGALEARRLVELRDRWLNPLEPLLLGWPAVALSVLVASFGLARRSPRPLVVAAALVGPITAYLALTPRFFVWGLFPVGAYLGAAVATRRHHRELGAALVVANAAFFAWLAVTIFG